MQNHPDQEARQECLNRVQESIIGYPTWDLCNQPIDVTSTVDLTYDQKRKIKIKKLNESAIVPTKANSDDAGYDLYSIEKVIVPSYEHVLIKTGISIAIPQGYVGLIWPRSGMALRSGIDVFAGVIDSGYRGEVGVILFNSGDEALEVYPKDRIAQILFQKIEDFDLVESEDLGESERQNGGYGSSGR